MKVIAVVLGAVWYVVGLPLLGPPFLPCLCVGLLVRYSAGWLAGALSNLGYWCALEVEFLLEGGSCFGAA